MRTKTGYLLSSTFATSTIMKWKTDSKRTDPLEVLQYRAMEQCDAKSASSSYPEFVHLCLTHIPTRHAVTYGHVCLS